MTNVSAVFGLFVLAAAIGAAIIIARKIRRYTPAGDAEDEETGTETRTPLDILLTEGPDE